MLVFSEFHIHNWFWYLISSAFQKSMKANELLFWNINLLLRNIAQSTVNIHKATESAHSKRKPCLISCGFSYSRFPHHSVSSDVRNLTRWKFAGSPIPMELVRVKNAQRCSPCVIWPDMVTKSQHAYRHFSFSSQNEGIGSFKWMSINWNWIETPEYNGTCVGITFELRSVLRAVSPVDLIGHARGYSSRSQAVSNARLSIHHALSSFSNRQHWYSAQCGQGMSENGLEIVEIEEGKACPISWTPPCYRSIGSRWRPLGSSVWRTVA